MGKEKCCNVKENKQGATKVSTNQMAEGSQTGQDDARRAPNGTQTDPGEEKQL